MPVFAKIVSWMWREDSWSTCLDVVHIGFIVSDTVVGWLRYGWVSKGLSRWEIRSNVEADLIAQAERDLRRSCRQVNQKQSLTLDLLFAQNKIENPILRQIVAVVVAKILEVAERWSASFLKSKPSTLPN